MKSQELRKGGVYIWRAGDRKFQSLLKVTQLTKHLVRARELAGSPSRPLVKVKSFWNPKCIFLDECSVAGQTAQQILQAPPLSVFIWVNKNLQYPRALARMLGRDDLCIKSPDWLGRMIEGPLRHIVVDHAAFLTSKERATVRAYRQMTAVKSTNKEARMSNNERPEILTRSGQYFNFLKPELYELHISDIGHGLAHCCRFVGQCKVFYSVAQHSVLLSHIVPPALAMSGLFHDAAEAFLGDVSRPLKRLLPDYRAIEERVERALFKQLEIPYPNPPEIKIADGQMLRLEQAKLMPHHSDAWSCDQYHWPPGITLDVSTALSPEEAFHAFMERYTELKFAPKGFV